MEQYDYLNAVSGTSPYEPNSTFQWANWKAAFIESWESLFTGIRKNITNEVTRMKKVVSAVFCSTIKQNKSH